VKRKVGVPFTVATEAASLSEQIGVTGKKARRNLYEKRDQIWAVFDRDAHPRFQDAVKLCAKSGVKVARSNPCFEVWLILHFQDFHKPDGRQKVQEHFRKLCPEYDPKKGKTPDCIKLVGTLGQAEKRAATQLKRRTDEGSAFGPPSTTVHLLIEAVRQAVK